jgi:hypothetical protein
MIKSKIGLLSIFLPTAMVVLLLGACRTAEPTPTPDIDTIVAATLTAVAGQGPCAAVRHWSF